MKDVGAAAEYRFASACLYQGWTPCWPSTDSAAYDMVIDTGKKLLRIQVKGTDKDEGTLHFSVKMRDHGKTRAYDKKDIDFLALYSFKSGDWYIIPASAVKLSLTVKPRDIWCKNLRYKNAWHLLDNSIDKR